MRLTTFVLMLSLFGSFLLGQEQNKPLTQAEYVKLLYELEKNPAKRDEIIQTIRIRGIAFELSDGIRGLTATKSRNDPELRRVLEEAARRYKNPSIGLLPSIEESNQLLEKTKKATLEAVEAMPDFVVKQLIQRSISYASTGNFQTLDHLIVAVSYRSNGQEEYKLLSVNGIIRDNTKPKQSYEEVGGVSSTGEFVNVLATIFKPESETKFQILDTDSVNDRRTVVYEFEITKDKARQQIVSMSGSFASTVTGMKGRIWIDRELFRVLRIESTATDIPPDFPIRAASRRIDYGWVKIADEKYLLPILADVRLIVRESGKLFETRNLIRFKEYQKFGTEVRVLDDDMAEQP